MELCDIYLSKQNFTKAQFCYEELLLVNPTNYQHNLKYAEILYSLAIASNGQLQMLELSRKYFSHALVLVDDITEKRVNNNVARALWGLIKVCKTIKSKNDKDPKNQEVVNQGNLPILFENKDDEDRMKIDYIITLGGDGTILWAAK